MKYTYAFLVKYRYYIFWSLTVLLLTEVVQPLIGIVSFEHERIFVWISFPTLLGWMGIATLIGVVSPVSDRVTKYAYFALTFVSLAIFVNIVLIAAGVYWHGFWDDGIPILFWLGIGWTYRSCRVIRSKHKSALDPSRLSIDYGLMDRAAYGD